jgi:iron complex transport system substrate-binding protein
MFRALKSIILGALLLIVIGGGCSRDKSEPPRKSSSEIHSVVSLSPNVSELVGVYGVPHLLKGRTSSCNYPPSIGSVPVTCDLKPNFEKLAYLKPQLIIYDPILYSHTDIQKLQELGLELFEFKTSSLEEWIASMNRLEGKLGKQISFSAYIQRVKRKLQKSRELLSPKRPRVAVLLGDSSQGEYYIAGLRTFQCDILKKLGCVPLGPDSEKFEKVDIERLISQNPEVIFSSEESETFFKDSRLYPVQAIRKRRVYTIEADILWRGGARVDQLIEAFTKALKGEKGAARNISPWRFFVAISSFCGKL